MSNRSSMYRDSRWQRKRLEVMERDGWKCRSCGKGKDDGILLNVHHINYVSGAKPWEYPDTELVTWCDECHGRIHNDMQELNQVIAGRGAKFAFQLTFMAQRAPEIIESWDWCIDGRKIADLLDYMVSNYCEAAGICDKVEEEDGR